MAYKIVPTAGALTKAKKFKKLSTDLVRQNFQVHSALIEQNKTATDLALKNARDAQNYSVTGIQKQDHGRPQQVHNCA